MTGAGLFEHAYRAAGTGGPSLWRDDAAVGAYEAGRIKRLDGEYLPRGLGPNAQAEAFNGLDLVARRWRDLVDNHPVIGGLIDHIVRNVVGTGIDEIEPDTGFPDVDEQLAAIQETAFAAVDPERRMTLAQSQQLAFREMLMGEVIVHWPVAEPWRETEAGPAIELIEMERLERGLTGELPDGHFVRQGVEFDAKKRVVAYHVLTENPRDSRFGFVGAASVPGLWNSSTRRVPISDADLLKITRRIGEIRGVPVGVSAIATARSEEKNVDDTMALVALLSRLGVFFTGGAVPAEFFKDRGGRPVLAIDAQGNPVMRIESGNVGFLPPGMELKVAAHNVPGPGFDVGQRGLHRRIAVATGATYAGTSGDYSQGNFSSQRAESLDARKAHRVRQELLYFGHTQPYRRRLFRWKLLTGELKLTPAQAREFEAKPERLVHASVGYPGWEYVNPSQEAQATGEDIANGVRSEIEAIQERGGNWKRTVRQRIKLEKFRREERVANGLPPDEAPRPRNGLALGERSKGGGQQDQQQQQDEGGDSAKADGGDS
jgi:lambda family phage portal protein